MIMLLRWLISGRQRVVGRARTKPSSPPSGDQRYDDGTYNHAGSDQDGGGDSCFFVRRVGRSHNGGNGCRISRSRRGCQAGNACASGQPVRQEKSSSGNRDHQQPQEDAKETSLNNPVQIKRASESEGKKRN